MMINLVTTNFSYLLSKVFDGLQCAVCLLLIPILTSVLVTGYVYADSEEIIQDNCRSCHGADGRAREESWPNLNCQNRGYLNRRLMHLRREDDHDIDKKVKTLSITEIDEISRYYAEQKCYRR